MDDSIPPTSPETPGTGWSIGLTDTRGFDAWLEAIQSGFESTAVEVLRQRLGLTLTDMATALGMSTRTLTRRQSDGSLTPDESDRLFRLARLFERATDVFGSEQKAQTWMTSEQWALGERRPIDVARFEPGAREVRDLLGRIEHGIPV